MVFKLFWRVIHPQGKEGGFSIREFELQTPASHEPIVAAPILTSFGKTRIRGIELHFVIAWCSSFQNPRVTRSCQTVARFASNKGKQKMKATVGRTYHHLNHNQQIYAGTWEMLSSGSDDDSDDLSIRTDSATVKMSKVGKRAVQKICANVPLNAGTKC